MTTRERLTEIETVLRLCAIDRSVWVAQTDDMIMLGKFISLGYERINPTGIGRGFYIHTDQLLLREGNGHEGSVAKRERDERKERLREGRVNLDNYPKVEEETLQGLSLEERETFLNATNVDRQNKVWIATSFDPVMQARLERIGAVLIEVEPPLLMRRYFLDWSQVLFRAGKKQISEETRKVLTDRLTQYRESRNANIS